MPTNINQLLQDIMKGAADFAFFRAIREYVYARIDLFTEQLLSNSLQLGISTVFVLMNLWIIIQGYLIATGRSQENLRGFLMGLGKSYFIIMIALGTASTHEMSVRTLTTNLSNGVSQVMADNDKYGIQCLTDPHVASCKIDMNLAIAQGLMGMIAAADAGDNEIRGQQIERAKWFAGVGAAGPAVVAGTMLLMYRIAISMFLGFAPIFILCLLFKKTAPLFQKWLYYGIATLFASVMLGIMTDLSSDLVQKIAAALFVGNLLTGGEAGIGGIMEAATQQLGLGLILSTLLITVPPMAGSFFSNMMGNFSYYSAFGNWNNKSGTAADRPPHVPGGTPAQHQTAQQIPFTQNYGNNAGAPPSSQATRVNNTSTPTPSAPPQGERVFRAAPSGHVPNPQGLRLPQSSPPPKD